MLDVGQRLLLRGQAEAGRGGGSSLRSKNNAGGDSSTGSGQASLLVEYLAGQCGQRRGGERSAEDKAGRWARLGAKADAGWCLD